MAETMIVSESLVAAWESGRQAIKPEYIEKLIGVLTFEPDIMVRIVNELVNGEVLPEWEGKWLAAEEDASSLWSFETTLINGEVCFPNQTDDPGNRRSRVMTTAVTSSEASPSRDVMAGTRAGGRRSVRP